MIIKVKYEDSDYTYEIPAQKVLKFLDITPEQLEVACKKAIIET
jgi:hypothetical protein